MTSPAVIPGSIPVLSCAETAAFEKKFFSNPANRETDFMARAAKGIAAETEHLFAEIRRRPIESILVLVGKGHNAADALIAARLLHDRCRATVKILLAQPVDDMVPLAKEALEKLTIVDAAFHVWDNSTDNSLNGPFDVLLDGLLGYNFRTPLRAPFAEIIRWANHRADSFKLRIAVDLPSGLGDDTHPDDPVLQVDATVACGLVKAPLLQENNISSRGRLRLACIGFPDTMAGNLCAGAQGLFSLGPLRKLRPPFADKRHYGHLFILGGSRTMPGALLMNVRAALQAGVGLLTVFCPESVHAAFAAAVPAAMWVPWPETPGGGLALEGEHLLRERLPRASALLCGSGMGAEPETSALLQSIVGRAECPVILDADALRNEILDAAKSRKSIEPLILLPHAGEFARIAPTPEASLRDTCRQLHATIALKGTPTRVADATREIVVCTGGPILARGGSGDLLAGITGALFARHLHNDPLQTLATAVSWHGAAADCTARQHGTESISTTDILFGFGPALHTRSPCPDY
ncbi:MAG: NAD(P)H-hydrate dehydratase [Puniceicoccales bacterium]|jgi:NAD(P)H-hydrate epimerase|nr:NAD(P)H-hydrate dehydratase [Puniceicoccales bacterium]